MGLEHRTLLDGNPSAYVGTDGYLHIERSNRHRVCTHRLVSNAGLFSLHMVALIPCPGAEAQASGPRRGFWQQHCHRDWPACGEQDVWSA